MIIWASPKREARFLSVFHVSIGFPLVCKTSDNVKPLVCKTVGM